MTLATILTQIMARTTNMLPGVSEKKVDSNTLLKQITPVSAFFAASLVLANKAYIYLAVSYIQALFLCFILSLHLIVNLSDAESVHACCGADLLLFLRTRENDLYGAVHRDAHMRGSCHHLDG